MRWQSSIFAAGIVFCAVDALAEEPAATVLARLTAAITCGGAADPLRTVQEIIGAGTTFGVDYTSLALVESGLYRGTVIFNKPITVAGAKTDAVMAETAPSNDDFNAAVYGWFRGDYHKVVSALNLSPSNLPPELRLGAFERWLRTDDAPTEECPYVIALTPLSDSQFLLGCGWCDG